jgi:DNA-binding CsgD family transcriptional regulator
MYAGEHKFIAMTNILIRENILLKIINIASKITLRYFRGLMTKIKTITHKFTSKELLSIIGFSCFFAWYLLIFFGSVRFYPVPVNENILLFIQAFGFISLFIASLILDYTIKHKQIRFYSPRLIIGTALCGLPLPLYCIVIPENVQLILGGWALAILLVPASIPAIIFLSSWGNIGGYINVPTIVRYFGLSLTFGIFLFLIITINKNSNTCWFLSIILLGASLLILLTLNEELHHLFNQISENHNYGKPHPRISGLSLALNVAFGIFWPYASITSKGNIPYILAIALLFLFIFTLIFHCMPKVRNNTINFLTRICVIGVSLGLVATLVAEGIWRIFFFGTIAAAWLIFWSALDSMLVQHAANMKLSVLRYTANIKKKCNLGFAIGWLYDSFVFLLTPNSFMAEIAIAVCAVAICIVCLCVLPALEQKTEINQQPEHSDKSLDKKCIQVSKHFDLTERESEILSLMVRGRNTHFIASKLVLSDNTVRSHIYNIYKKTDLHSQQSLIDYVEESNLDPFEK